MNWFWLALGNMLTLAVLRLIQKPFIDNTKLNAFRVNWIMHILAMPFLVALTIFYRSEIAALSGEFWLILIAVVICFYPLVDYLYFKTVRSNRLSYILPLLGLIPVFTLLIGWLLLGQTPSLRGVLGVLLISLGIYTLQLAPNMSFLGPLKKLKSDSATKAVIIISITTAFAAIGDTYAIGLSSPKIYLILNMIGAFLILFLVDILHSRPNISSLVGETLTEMKKFKYTIVAMSALLIAVQFLGFAALSKAPVAGYAVGIRNLNLVLASLMAIAILKEKVTKYSIVSYVISAVGIVLISL